MNNQLALEEEQQKKSSTLMKLLRIVLIIGLVILLAVLAKKFLWPMKEVSIGVESPGSFNLTEMSFLRK
jgi:flagellar basal body-associated protein FliL